MELYLHILLLTLNFAVYLISFVLIIKRRKYSAVSIRSPTLLFFNNLGGFLMTSIFLSYEMIENYNWKKDDFTLFCKILPNNYMVCHFLMMLSFILRCHRIIECCKINYDERVEIHEFYKKRHIFQEKFYIRIMFACIVVLIFLGLILNFEFDDYVIIPYHFTNCMKNAQTSEFYTSLIWVIINFMEGMLLLTYCYFITINSIKLKVKFELFSFVIVWFLYPNILRANDLIFLGKFGNESHWTVYLSILFLYICLGINGFLPPVLSYLDKTSTSYHFNPKLASNLYLFLSEEHCYLSFHEFLNKSDKDKFYLQLYTQIMKYKYNYTMEQDTSKVICIANEIYHYYFEGNVNHSEGYLESELTNKIKNICQMLFKEECGYEMFDDALVVCYEYLEGRFEDYMKSEEYQLLIDNLNLHSYIQCKMCNTGLINKY